MELEYVDPLIRQYALPRQQLIERPLKSEEPRGIRAEAEVHADGSHGSAITNPESYGLNHIVKVLQVLLAEAETDVIDIGVHVAHVVEQHAADVVPEQREAQFGRMKQQSVAAQRKSRL